MRGVARLVGVELLWLVGGCLLGMVLWVAVASSYNEASDAYWTANGHPPPPGTGYDSPFHLRFVYLFAPYATSVVIRLLAIGTRRRRASAGQSLIAN